MLVKRPQAAICWGRQYICAECDICRLDLPVHWRTELCRMKLSYKQCRGMIVLHVCHCNGRLRCVGRDVMVNISNAILCRDDTFKMKTQRNARLHLFQQCCKCYVHHTCQSSVHLAYWSRDKQHQFCWRNFLMHISCKKTISFWSKMPL